MGSSASLPRRTGTTARQRLIERARYDYKPELVRINDELIKELELPGGELKLMSTGLAQKKAGQKLSSAIRYTLIRNSLNFQFWDLKDDKFVRYESDRVVGATLMRQQFDLHWGDEEGPTRFREAFVERGIKGIFGDIPAARERTWILEDALFHQFWFPAVGALEWSIGEVGAFTVGDAEIIAMMLPSGYRDRYLKKAQLALMEIAGYCAEIGIPVDCSELTLCADYQLPRVLRAMGILEYAPEFAAKVDSQRLIEKDSEEERAIRAATVLAGDLLSSVLGAPAAAIDNFLWTHRALAGNTRFHLTMTTNY